MVLTIVPLLQDKACSTVQTARLGKIVKTRGECQRQKWIGSLPSFVELVRYAQTHRCVTEKKGGPCEGRSWKKLERLRMKRPKPWEVACLTPGPIENSHTQAFGWKTPRIHKALLWRQNTKNGMVTSGCQEHRDCKMLLCPREEEKKLAHNNIVIKKRVNLPQNDIRCMKTRQSLQSFQCPGLKSTLSRPKQGFNCQGQLMRATSAPSNLQGQRQSVINCCVHKCKWVHWGSRRRGGGKGLSGQYSSGEQSAREGNDLEDSTQICCSVKHEEAECEGRLVEMEEVVVRIGRKNNGNNCGGNKYQPFYSSCLFSIRPLQRYGLSHHQNKKKNTISHCSCSATLWQNVSFFFLFSCTHSIL